MIGTSVVSTCSFTTTRTTALEKEKERRRALKKIDLFRPTYKYTDARRTLGRHLAWLSAPKNKKKEWSEIEKDWTKRLENRCLQELTNLWGRAPGRFGRHVLVYTLPDVPKPASIDVRVKSFPIMIHTHLTQWRLPIKKRVWPQNCKEFAIAQRHSFCKYRSCAQT